jgi:hypothetical protein
MCRNIKTLFNFEPPVTVNYARQTLCAPLRKL